MTKEELLNAEIVFKSTLENNSFDEIVRMVLVEKLNDFQRGLDAFITEEEYKETITKVTPLSPSPWLKKSTTVTKRQEDAISKLKNLLNELKGYNAKDSFCSKCNILGGPVYFNYSLTEEKKIQLSSIQIDKCLSLNQSVKKYYLNFQSGIKLILEMVEPLFCSDGNTIYVTELYELEPDGNLVKYEVSQVWKNIFYFESVEVDLQTLATQEFNLLVKQFYLVEITPLGDTNHIDTYFSVKDRYEFLMSREEFDVAESQG